MKISKIFYVTIGFIGITAISIYCLWLFALPTLLSSPKMEAKYETFLSNKLNTPIDIKNFKIKTHPNLSFDASIDEFLAPNIASVKNFTYKTKSFSLKPAKLTAEDIFLDFEKLKPLLKSDKQKEKTELNLDFFPLIDVNHALIQNNIAKIELNNIHSQKQGQNIVCNFEGKIKTEYTKSPIIVGKSGGMHYFKTLYFDDLSLSLDNSTLFLGGTLKEITIKGKALPVKELEPAFLYFYKLKHPNKKNFIENFSNFSGTLDVDLAYSERGLLGKCIAQNLRADFFNLRIPIHLPHVVFNFDKKTMSAKTTGTFGLEPVYTDVNIKEMFSDKLNVVGNVKSTFTNKITSKYYNSVKIINSVDANVKYFVKNGIVDIDYNLFIPKESNLIFKNNALPYKNIPRQILAHTQKNGDTITLTRYEFNLLNGEKFNMLLGDGLFIKQHGHFKPQFLTLKTNGNISTKLLKPFIGNYIYGGDFYSDLKYTFNDNKLHGVLKLNKIYHKDFLYLENVDIKTLQDNIKVNMNGTFFDSPITISLKSNTVINNLVVDDIDIHLNNFIVKKGEINDSSLSGIKNTRQIPKITVKQGRIKVDTISNSRFCLQNVEILGSLKNDIAHFVIPQAEYAKGILSAKGIYNLANHSSNIKFLASDIDSNEVATSIFHLPNQFEGYAYAYLDLQTKNKFNDIKASANFAIEDGFLPKLGSREFIINKTSKKRGILAKIQKPFKFTLSKISNIDFSKPNIFYSDLRGSFLLNNSEISNVKIFSQSDYLSMFIEGNYNIDSEIGDLTMWGKHNKVAEKKIRILKLPLSLLYKIFFRVERSKLQNMDKIKLIPPIIAKDEEIGIFRVQVNGNLNNNEVKIILKDLK